MKLTIAHLLDLIDELPKGKDFDYVSGGDSKAKLVSIDRENVKVDIVRINADGSEKNASMTTDILNTLVNSIKENKPFKFDNVLNGSGNVRSTMEAIFAHTTEFYFCKISNVKHLVWIPTRKKGVGKLEEISILEIPDSATEDILPTESVREEFKYFLCNCVKSTRGKNRLGTLTDSSVNSYLSMLDKREDGSIKLFDYNPSRWVFIKDIYELVTPLKVEELYQTLLNDPDFLARDTSDNNGWRSGAINYYVLFLRARKYFSRGTQLNNPHLSTIIIPPLQQIFYGAPGTGKSNTIKNVVDEQKKRCHRTTFHPDSDYSTFVGAYKPTMKESYITKDGVTTKEERIIYTFCPQAFTNAYVEAWNTEEEVYLVIEEINRGNCAQIFGDLFQLLDRKNGVSEYPVEADADLQNYLNKALAKTTRTDIPDDVKSGKKLMLPSNLYIWATMNTSDQSLFPIDSAFKRRWEWKYIKIKEGRDENGNKLDWKVDVKMDEAGSLLPWWAFIQKINEIIALMTSSADKQLGYFFCCAKDGVIDEETFVSKVIFYLWNDVFKDYGFEDASLFRYTDNDSKEKDLTFPDFYDEDGEKVNTERLTDFVKKVMNWKKTSEENN